MTNDVAVELGAKLEAALEADVNMRGVDSPNGATLQCNSPPGAVGSIEIL